MLVQYRKHLRTLGPLWSQASELGRCGNVIVSPRAADEMLNRLEMAVSCLMEKGVQVERARQEMLDLKASLDISRQTVEAKSKHLGQEERQKEEEQGLRFKEFKRIHRLQDEKAALEKELVPAKRRLAQISEVLDEKSEKMRNLEVSHLFICGVVGITTECWSLGQTVAGSNTTPYLKRHFTRSFISSWNFYDILSDYCEQGMTSLKQQTDEARSERAKWDKLDLDIGKEVRDFAVDNESLAKVEDIVCDLSNMIQHHKQWYEEEMQTKLFYSTRSKEIKHKLAYYRSVLRRMENSGRSDDVDEDVEGRRLSRRSENILVDGSPGVQAKEVENYLSRQFGMRVLADYTMLKRLKDEIGVQGLAYLVEKVRLQGETTPADSQACSGITSAPTFADWEEQRVEQALKGIAFEYRDSEESKHLLRPVNQTSISGPTLAPVSRISPRTSPPQLPQQAPPLAPPLNSPPSSVCVTSPSSRGSNSSLRRKSSMARLRRLFKL
ncbi:hypothetical protein PoB_007563600 [Plakobranchus ocellatus]|uniref:Uncharacterized protein n=1 Tax=Plakobranchus ocellatus TaxID=259542 RepID=A0AAV4DYF8_9GAST|nr:hypothetical protein PoB_007563600 [Plakobranchus ocellatus]